jgi:hypothetical protein
VKVNVPQAVTRLGDRLLGAGNIELNVSPGEANLIVEVSASTPSRTTAPISSDRASNTHSIRRASGLQPCCS